MKSGLAQQVDPKTLSFAPELRPALRKYLEASLAPATRRAYASDWRRFEAWCKEVLRTALPADPDTITGFLLWEIDVAGTHVNTLGRRLAAIRFVHRSIKLESLPTDAELVRRTLRGIRRAHGTQPTKKAPALAADIKAMVDTVDLTTLKGLRDRVLVLLGFAGAFRRSELVALNVEDLEPRGDEGLIVHIRRSKTDQEGRGVTKPILPARNPAYCPIEAVCAWRAAAGIDQGPLLRRLYRGARKVGHDALKPGSVALIIKQLAIRAGLDPAHFAGHSLRRGWLTSAAGNGATLDKMRRVSGHRSLNTLLEYVDDAEQFQDHAGEGLL